MKNQVQLITYVDRFSGGGFNTLETLIKKEFSGVFGGAHILPFYYPIDGSDAGFDPIDHSLVDHRLGTWTDVKALSDQVEIMADLIVNHMSAQSPEFQDVLEKAEASEFWDLFLKEQDIFPAGITPEEAKQIYRPRPGSCFSKKALKDGREINFWTTFTDNQIDINVYSPAGQAYLEKVLQLFAANGVKIIRLDAAGYAIKKAGTSCFMLDETFAFVNALSKRANELGMETVAEIHSHYQTQVNVATRVDRVYDFALPPLILHTLFSQDVTALFKWLEIAPRNCLTVLDTHDGIGIIDAGPAGDKAGLLNAAQIDALVETIHDKSQGQSRKATGAAASNVDLYQVNCTYYDALGQDNFHYLLARAIQFFAPGVPQVYYGGLLTLSNDMDLLAKTNVGRDINRPYIDPETLTSAKAKTVTQGLLALIALRNSHSAFDGEFSFLASGATAIMKWTEKTTSLALQFNLATRQALIVEEAEQVTIRLDLSSYS
ncbi:sucrose phosphorylase [Pseudoalteromonas fenneropenaei]|uniref:Sucrose phosphorylase n=1 Tax=Pseudoalteromonas fenneropenaei TaxID=1737459 RepID=A0ABV7CJF2_9GAMM